MPLDWKSSPLAEGIRCYRNREFWLAHEHWESVWLRLQEPQKTFLQSLIQITAAFHHVQNGNAVGAASLLRRALRRLEPYPELFEGINLAQLRLEAGEWLRALERDSHPHPSTVPEILPTG